MIVSGVPSWTSLVTVMLLFGSSHPQKGKIFLGRSFIHMVSKVRVDGILRILVPLLVKRILYLKWTLNYGTVELSQTKILRDNESGGCSMCLIFLLWAILQTLRTRERSSYTSMGRRSLIRFKKQCNLNLRMKIQSIHLIFGKVQISSWRFVKLLDLSITIRVSLNLHLF